MLAARNCKPSPAQTYQEPTRNEDAEMKLQRFLLDCYGYLMYGFISSMLVWMPLLWLALLLTPSLRIVSILYLVWMYYDRTSCHTGDRRLQVLRKWKFWRHRRDYFPIRLVKTVDLPSDATYLFSCFPHGLLAYGVSTNFGCDTNGFDQQFPGLNPYVMTLNAVFYIPFLRELFLLLGVRAVSKEAISHVLRGPAGNVCVVVVGGMAEVFKSSPAPAAAAGTYKLVLKNRKGFVKMAMQTGSTLVPVFSFAEIDTFEQIPKKWYQWAPKKINQLIGFLLLLIYKGQCILPRRRPITTVVGEPIKLPKVENPANELVDKYHAIFTNELIELFEKNKVKYDPRGNEATLIVE